MTTRNQFSHQKLTSYNAQTHAKFDRMEACLAEIKTLVLQRWSPHQQKGVSSAGNFQRPLSCIQNHNSTGFSQLHFQKPSDLVQNQHSTLDLRIDFQNQSDAPDEDLSEAAANTAEEDFSDHHQSLFDDLVADPASEIVNEQKSMDPTPFFFDLPLTGEDGTEKSQVEDNRVANPMTEGNKFTAVADSVAVIVDEQKVPPPNSVSIRSETSLPCFNFIFFSCFDFDRSQSLLLSPKRFELISKPFSPFSSRAAPSSALPFSSDQSFSSPAKVDFPLMELSLAPASGWPWVQRIRAPNEMCEGNVRTEHGLVGIIAELGLFTDLGLVMGWTLMLMNGKWAQREVQNFSMEKVRSFTNIASFPCFCLGQFCICNIHSDIVGNTLRKSPDLIHIGSCVLLLLLHGMDLAKKLGCNLGLISPMAVTKEGGARLQALRTCRAFNWHLQQTKFISNVLVFLLTENGTKTLQEFVLKSEDKKRTYSSVVIATVSLFGHPLPRSSLLFLQRDESVAVLHRKKIHRGSVLVSKVMVKWRDLPPKHGTWEFYNDHLKTFIPFHP